MPADKHDGDGYNHWRTALAAMPVGITHVILHRADATGDIPHVLAVLANDDHVGVVVFDAQTVHNHQKTNNSGPGRVADTIADYGAANRFGVGANSRIKYANFGGNWAPTHNPMQIHGGRQFQRMSLFSATQHFQAALEGEGARGKYNAVKTMLRGEKMSSEAAAILRDKPNGELNLDQVDDYCMNYWKDRIALDVHTVVLWGRKSGKGGGMHPTQDHSYTTWADVSEACADRHYQVVVAGDYDPKDTSDARNLINNFATIIIGRFYQDNLMLATRARQARLFYILKRVLKTNGKRLVHVGMRSGGMDFLGFAGQRIIYITGTRGDNSPIPDGRMAGVVESYKTFRANEGGIKVNKYQKFQAPRNPKRLARGAAEKRDAKGIGEEGTNALVAQIAAAMGEE